jgi:hypothetical protein
LNKISYSAEYSDLDINESWRIDSSKKPQAPVPKTKSRKNELLSAAPLNQADGLLVETKEKVLRLKK